MDNHPDEKPVIISGSKVREALTKGERPDPRILRPEIADILIDYYRTKVGEAGLVRCLWRVDAARTIRQRPSRARRRPYRSLPSISGTSNTRSCWIGPWPK